MSQLNTSSLPQGFKPPHLISGRPESSAILIGLSGGADSTALLHILCRYAQKSGAMLYAAHVNHGIRGAEADRDEAFCRELCERLGVVFFSVRLDIPQIALESGESVETAARRKRYEYFDSLMRDNNVGLLATAHNADDNLETVIFNIARGTGLGGLCGIPECRPCEQGLVIRPILNMEKREILEYCRDNGLEFVTDSTNTDTDYTRNKIRAQIIPVMRQINSGAVKNAARMSERLREDSLCLERMTDLFIEELRSDRSIEVERVRSSPASVVNRALMRLYDGLSSEHTLEQAHINALTSSAIAAVPHSSVSLPDNVEGVIENGRLYIRHKREQTEAIEYSLPLCEGKNPISQTDCEIFIGASHSSQNIYKNSILLSIDSAKINGGLYARERRAGDRLRIGGMSKSVKKLMCDKKIPLELRSRLPVICDGEGILAIPMLGIRDGAKPRKENTSADGVTYIEVILH